MAGEVNEKTGRHSLLSILAGFVAAKAIGEVLVEPTVRSLNLPLPGWVTRLATLGACYGAARFTHSGVSEGLLLSCLGGAAVSAIGALPQLGPPDSVNASTSWRFEVDPTQLFQADPAVFATPRGRNAGSPE